MKRLIGLAVCAVLALSSTARAQGIQTGTITGIVQSSDGLSLPGVTVTATSPSLQGQRTAVTDVNGVYFIKGLPAGTYSVSFSVAKTAKPWIKLEFYNVLNNQKQIAWDKTVTPDNNGPKDTDGLPLNYVQGPRFGQATNDNQFPQPIPGQNGGRLFRMALGMRF